MKQTTQIKITLAMLDVAGSGNWVKVLEIFEFSSILELVYIAQAQIIRFCIPQVWYDSCMWHLNNLVRIFFLSVNDGVGLYAILSGWLPVGLVMASFDSWTAMGKYWCKCALWEILYKGVGMVSMGCENRAKNTLMVSGRSAAFCFFRISCLCGEWTALNQT